jgi:hypothetical protein
VLVSTLGLPVSKFSRGSGARVTMNWVADVSIFNRIAVLSLLVSSAVIGARESKNSPSTATAGSHRQ